MKTAPSRSRLPRRWKNRGISCSVGAGRVGFGPVSSVPPATQIGKADDSASAARRPGSFIDPKALMAIQNLELRARVVVEGFWSGIHRSPYHGFSVEFSEYREYAPGDDPRFLDWKLYGRSDRHYVKKFEDETNLRCFLLLDQSRSMDYGSKGVLKSDYARTLAATVARFLYLQGDAVGLLVFDQQIREAVPARHRPGHLRRLTVAMESECGGESTDLASPLRRLLDILKRRSLALFVSDFMSPLEGIETPLGSLRAAGHEAVVFQIVDPMEEDLAFGETVRLRDLETGKEMDLDADAIRGRYRKKMEEHRARLAAICAKHGAVLHVVRTDRPLEWALLDFLRMRSRRGRARVAKGGS